MIDTSRRLLALAGKVAYLPSDTQARRGIKGVMLGAVYGLIRAEELGYEPRIGESLGPSYDDELVETGTALLGGSAPPRQWLSGFYWGSALLRMAAVYERTLRLLLSDDKSKRFELEKNALSEGIVTEQEITNLRWAFHDANVMKHADGKLLKVRKLKSIHDATTAAEQLYEMLQRACQSDSAVG